MKTNDQFHHLTSYSRHGDFNAYLVSLLTKRFGQRFVDYRRDWELTERERKFVPPFPLLVGIETIDKCNLKCGHCVRRHASASGVKLSWEAYTRVIDEGKEHGLPCIVFGAGNEPLMAPDILETLRYALRQGIMDVFLSTNGTLLTEQMVDALVGMELTRLEVSIDAATAETYKRVRGLDCYDKLVHLIRHTIAKREAAGSKLPLVRVSFVYQEGNQHEADEFIRQWHDVADKVDIQNLIDYTHLGVIKDVEVPPFFCPFPWNRVSIDAKGSISPCCTFYSRYFVGGNIHKDTIKAAWDSPLFRELRESLVNGRYFKVCKNCFGDLKTNFTAAS